MFHRHPRRPSRGFSLTELAVVMAVIGFILGAVWAGMATVLQRERANDGMLQYKLIADNIRALYNAASYNGSKGIPCGNQTPCASSMTDITAAMVTAGAIPANMVQSGGTTVIDPEGGTLSVYVIPNSPGATNQQFEITAYSTPKTCSNVLAYLAAEASDLNIAYVYDDAHGWQNPANNALDVTSFSGCTTSAVSFNLH